MRYVLLASYLTISTKKAEELGLPIYFHDKLQKPYVINGNGSFIIVQDKPSGKKKKDNIEVNVNKNKSKYKKKDKNKENHEFYPLNYSDEIMNQVIVYSMPKKYRKLGQQLHLEILNGKKIMYYVKDSNVKYRPELYQVTRKEYKELLRKGQAIYSNKHTRKLRKALAEASK